MVVSSQVSKIGIVVVVDVVVAVVRVVFEKFHNLVEEVFSPCSSLNSVKDFLSIQQSKNRSQVHVFFRRFFFLSNLEMLPCISFFSPFILPDVDTSLQSFHESAISENQIDSHSHGCGLWHLKDFGVSIW